MKEDIQKQNSNYYNTESVVYDDNRYGSVAGQRVESFHKRVLDRLLVENLPENASVLEMGCGTGRLLNHLAPKQFRLFGIDMSTGMLSVAKERLQGEQFDVQLKEASVTDVPFESGTFDAAYSILVVNLIPDYPKMFKEAGRLIKPGGLFVFNVPNLISIYFPGGLYVNARGKTVGSNEVGYRYSHWFTPREWKKALADAGFSVEEVLGQPPQLRMVDEAAPLNASGVGLLFSKSVYVKAIRNGG